MASNTVIQQGSFTSTGTSVTIPFVIGVDWMEVKNITVATNNQTNALGVEYYWQRGFPSGAAWEYLKSNAANANNLSRYLTTGGFTFVDTSGNPNAQLNNGSTGVSAVSTAGIPVATVGSTTGMSAGNIVRLYSIPGAGQLNGIDFTVGYNTFSGTTFSLDYMSQLAAAGTATGNFRVINFDPIYYPRSRYITKITQATQAVVTLSVTHGYQVGQTVRFSVPSAYGMVEMDGLLGTITAVDTTTTTGNTITVNIDSSAFTTFAFPSAASLAGGPFTPAQVGPVGEDTAQALISNVNILSDATTNTGYRGIILAAGANSPAGQANDVIYWRAGSSFSVSNQ